MGQLPKHVGAEVDLDGAGSEIEEEEEDLRALRIAGFELQSEGAFCGGEESLRRGGESSAEEWLRVRC